MNNANVESVSASCRLPEFYMNDPRLWFLQADATFAAERITSQTSKFNRVVSQLPTEVVLQITDLITTPGDTPYDRLKEHLLTRFGISQERRILSLLDSSSIGDQKPSHALNKLRYIAGSATPTDMIRAIWMKQLPASTQQALIASQSSDLDDLARIADRLAEIETPTIAAASPNLMLEHLQAQIDKLTNQVTVAAAVLNAASAQLFPFSSLRSYIDQHHAESVDLPTQAPPPVDAYRYLHETGSSYIEPSGADSEVTERTVIVTPKPKYIPQRLVPEPSVDPNSPHIPSIGIGGNHSPSEPHQLSSILSPIRSVTIEKPSKIPSKNSKYEPILLKESPAKKPQYYEKTIVESRPSLSVTIPLDGYKKDTGGLIDFLVPPKYPSVYETHMKTMVPSTNNLDSDTDLKQTSAIPVKTKKNKKKNKLKIKGDSSSLGSEKRYRVRTRPPKITKNEPIELHASGTEVYLRPPQSYRPPPISSTPHPIEEQIAAETNFGLGGAGGGERVEFQLHGQNGPESYKFGFDTGDGKNRHFRYEEKDNSGKVKGHYGYYDKTGKLQVVNYHADDTGFHTSSS